MRYILFHLVITLLAVQANARENKLTGQVLDAGTRHPLVGATVQLSGAGSTITDQDGLFTMDCEGTSEITIRYLGYEVYKQAVVDCNETLSISLKPSGNNIDEIEITETSNSDKSILSQPASIAKLGIRELKRGNGLFLDDAVNGNIPGVFMERRSVSGGQQFNIRGYGNGLGARGANNNFDGQGLKVYLNGIPVTDAEGITLLDDIDFGSVGNVEVIKGPAGSLYGLAIAGVVNLSTIRPQAGKVSFGQDILVGSYGLRRYTTHLQMGGPRSSLLVNYGRQTSDGYLEKHSGSRKDFINVMGSFQPNKKENIDVYFGYSNSYDERAGELTIVQYEKKDYSGNPNYIKNDAHSQITSFRAGLGHTYTFNKNIANTTSVFASGVSNNSSSAAGWTDKAPINYGLRSTMNMNFNLGTDFTLSGITGVESQAQNAEIIGYAMIADSADLAGYNKIGSTKSNQVIFTSTTSVFTDWTLSMPYHFSITAGIGWSTMDIRLNDRFYIAGSTKPSSYAASYHDMFSPHVAVNKIFSKQVSAYMSYSKGYKAPVSANIYIPVTGKVNTGLKPETGDQFEIGTKGLLLHNRLTYQIALFSTKFGNKMTSVAVPLDSTTTAYSYTANGGSQKNKGVEVLVKYNLYQSSNSFIHSVSPFANLCYSHFRYDDFQFQSLNSKQELAIQDYSGKPVAGVAPYTANAGIDVLTRFGMYANVNYSYRDGMPISSDGVSKTTSYNLLNAKLGVQQTLFKHLGFDVFFGANNMTGTQYYYMVFINQLPDAYLPAPDKINYFGGISLKYTL